MALLPARKITEIGKESIDKIIDINRKGVIKINTLSIVGALTGIIGAVSGIIGTIMGILGVVHNRYLVINQYMEKMEEKDFIEARSHVYNWSPDQSIPIDNIDASIVVNFFHHWGLLVKKNYLPIWIFDSGSGNGVIRLYELTENYIMERRQVNHDSTYARNFEWLYHKLKRRKLQKGW